MKILSRLLSRCSALTELQSPSDASQRASSGNREIPRLPSLKQIVETSEKSQKPDSDHQQ